MDDQDNIEISDLRVVSRVGVPDAERARPQSLVVSLQLVPTAGFAGLGDDIAETVDYYAVSELVRDTAASGERSLIETLAGDLADVVLGEFPVSRVRVSVKKRILADAGHVAATVVRAQ